MDNRDDCLERGPVRDLLFEHGRPFLRRHRGGIWRVSGHDHVHWVDMLHPRTWILSA